MPEKIYTSPYPSVPLVNTSIYTFLFSNDQHLSAGKEAAYIDADTGKSLTRNDTKRLTLEFAWGARNQLAKLGGPKLTRGSTIMIFSPNSIAYPILLFGGLAAGFKCTLANSAYTPPELAHQYHDSMAEVVFVHPSLLQVVLDMFALLKISPEEARKKIVIASYGLPGKLPSGFVAMDDLLGKGSFKEEEKFNGKDSNETALICYSSGTTGKPKGVETTHKNVTSNLQMTSAMCDWLARGKDISLAMLPFYHIYGAIQILHHFFLLAVPVVILSKFEPVIFFSSIEKYKITFIYVVPPVLLAIVHHPASLKYNMSSITCLLSAAAPLGSPLAVAVRQKLKKVTGRDVIVGQGYGLTETSPALHILKPEHSITKAGSIGCLHPCIEARLVNEEDDGALTDAMEGEPGELWVRGANIMKGYLNNKAATKNSITSDGWFKTGDVAIRDKEGFYYIVDRRKELIKYKGFQVPPAELESLLLQHPDVADAAVIGIESVAEATELPRGYIVPAKPLKTDAEKAALSKAVGAWVQTKVAKHKFLRGGVIIIDAIPKSAAGKILRKDLRERAKKELSAEQSTKAKL